MKKRRVLTLSTLMAVGVMVGACSGGGTEASDALTVTVQEFQFSPNTWSVPAGEQVSIVITNNGTVIHEWVLLKEGVAIASEDDLPDTEEELLADFVYVEAEVEAGETETLTFQAPPAGTYQIICAVEDHFASGMEGTLTSTG